MGWHWGRMILPEPTKCYFFSTSPCAGHNISGKQETFDFSFEFWFLDFWGHTQLERFMQGSVELSTPKDGLHTSSVRCKVLRHSRVMDMKENRTKAHILYLRVSVAVPQERGQLIMSKGVGVPQAQGQGRSVWVCVPPASSVNAALDPGLCTSARSRSPASQWAHPSVRQPCPYCLCSSEGSSFLSLWGPFSFHIQKK